MIIMAVPHSAMPEGQRIVIVIIFRCSLKVQEIVLGKSFGFSN